MLEPHIKLVEWEVQVGEKRRRHRLEYAPGYGMVSPNSMTNGNWWEAACFMLADLDFACFLFNREGFADKMTVDALAIPQEILDLANKYTEYNLSAPTEHDIVVRNRNLNVFVQPAILVLRKLLEDQWFVGDPQRGYKKVAQPGLVPDAPS